MKLTWLFALTVLIAVPLVHADDSGYPWRETGYIPVAVGTPEETLLMYQVMFPNPAVWGPGPYPIVVDYSGYEPATTIYDGLDDRLLAAGYAMAGVNMRGSHGSGGTFDYFHPQQARDGADAIEWLASRSWCTGRVGMSGKSWPGISQLYVAAQRPSSLKAIVPGHVFTDLYRDVPYPGGILNATFAGYWSLSRVYEGYITGPLYYSEYQDEQALENQLGHVPNVLLNPLVRLLTQQYDNEFFRERSNWYFVDQIEAPMLLVQAWQDEQVGSRAVHLLERVHPALEWRFIGTNGDHAEYFGPDVWPHIIRFLSYHLKQEVPLDERRMVTAPLILPNGKPHPNKVVTRPETYEEALARYNAEDPVIINWENGARGGRSGSWSQTYGDWPPPNQTVWRMNMHPDGTLSEQGYPKPPASWLLGLLTPHALGAVDYVYSPLVGVQERGGYNIEDPVLGEEVVPPGEWSDRPPAGTFSEFTSGPLIEDKVLLGTASVDLYVTSTAPDTDFEVTLSEIRPDGYEVFVQQGWLRASHRREDTSLSTPLRPYHTHQFTDASLLLAGEPTKVRIEIFPFGHVFRQGSRIRVAITAPHTHPDLWGFAVMPIPAVNTIFTSRVYPSSVALPLLEGDSAATDYPPAGSLRNQPARIAEETPALLVLPALAPEGETVDAVVTETVSLLEVGETMTTPDAGDFMDLGEPGIDWFSVWASEVKLDTMDTAPAGETISPAVEEAWHAEVAATDFDVTQPDEWFVEWFDSWYAAWID